MPLFLDFLDNIMIFPVAGSVKLRRHLWGQCGSHAIEGCLKLFPATGWSMIYARRRTKGWCWGRSFSKMGLRNRQAGEFDTKSVARKPV